MVIVALVGGTGWYVLSSRNKANDSYDKADGSSEVELSKGLKVTSDPAGIDVAGDPVCDSKKLAKVTPYGCPEAESQTTTLTAQENVTVNGQAYKFKTWDGCSEGNADKKICKVKVDSGKLKTAKASYEQGTTNVSSSYVGCPAASKYIIIGPQAFVPEKPEKLVLYNRARDYTQSTNAQFWSDNSCKEITLNSGLKATKVEGSLNAGFGLAASSFVTRSSERTTIPPGGHTYIAVVDKPRYQYLQAIFRDDGTLMLDNAGLRKTVDPSGDETYSNSDGNIFWNFKGWIDSHTALFWIPWKISGPHSDCYAFDFDTGTHAEADSSLCSW